MALLLLLVSCSFLSFNTLLIRVSFLTFFRWQLGPKLTRGVVVWPQSNCCNSNLLLHWRLCRCKYVIEVYKSLAIEMELCLWSMQIAITLTESALTIFSNSGLKNSLICVGWKDRLKRWVRAKFFWYALGNILGAQVGSSSLGQENFALKK